MKYFLYFSLFIFLMIDSSVNAQLQFGLTGAGQLNSATLPDFKVNESVESVLNGDDVAKGVAQYANIKINYRIGGVLKYRDGVGFAELNSELNNAVIYKKVKLLDGFLGEYSFDVLDRKYQYWTNSLGYNVYLNKDKHVFTGLGGSVGVLLSHTGDEKPEDIHWGVYWKLGADLNEKVSVYTKLELGINEVYDGSYIHHIMIPIGICVNF